MRVISRLDIKGEKLIKGIKFEGLRPIGCPIQKAKEYYDNGIDEIICIDTVASLYGRNNAVKLVKEISKNIFLPITVCGGIRTIEDASNIILNGADKIGINTAAVANPQFLTILAKEFGSQSIVLSVEAKKKSSSAWEVFVNSGRDPTGIDVKLWIKKAVDLGIGSVFLTPKDMNEQFYFPEGNIDHMMLTEGQNFDKRTFSKIDGSFYSYGNMKDIFYCGAGSYPCGSVAGTAGYMCFKNIINN